MKIAKHFAIQELVPEHVYQARGQNAWQLIDSRLIELIDLMRDRHGPMVINTWHSEKLSAAYGRREWSGLRTLPYWVQGSGTDEGIRLYMASYSQHKYGRAFDALFGDVSAEAVRQDVRDHPELYTGLTAIEKATRWFHGDVRNVTPIMEFNP